jgi:LDH2 family malate/lactate/ureidoglycolate dehydrogenase
VDDYESKAASVIEAVKASGVGIRIPGERSALSALEREKAGVLPIPEAIWESILQTSSATK